MGRGGISKSQVSRRCAEIDERVNAFLEHPLEGDWPSLGIDASYVQGAAGGRIVSVAVIIAVGVNSDGRRVVLGLASALPTDAPRLARGEADHLPRPPKVSKPRLPRCESDLTDCRVHFMRNVLAHANKDQRQKVAVLIGTIFAYETAAAAHAQWRVVTAQLAERLPKLERLMLDAEDDVLAYFDFPKEHRTKLRSTNTLERLKARSNVAPMSSASSPRKPPSSA